ncbi:MAG: hypothetical protein H0W24_05245 [Lysobacter sp.]|nr:hypothetical protein [Lysobacter sp.]
MSTKTMPLLFRWSAPLALAVGLGAAALAPAPAFAQSGDELARVIVDVADVILRDDGAYDRRGEYGHDDRLIVGRDRYGRPVYYRELPRHERAGPPYGNAHGYHGTAPGQQKKVKCDSHGRCQVKSKGKHKNKQHYYDARYDTRYDERYYSGHHDDDRRRDDRRRDDRRR